jgi:hypothetical protein
LKHWLASQRRQPATLTELQQLLSQFAAIYNHQRPHRSLPRHRTPAAAYAARTKAAPGNRDADTHDRVCTDKIWAVCLGHGLICGQPGRASFGQHHVRRCM